ncbi:hypothetical protein BBD42_15440 [Paenibacillus sp. BIHB 4019]|uniref:YqaJ viral recombinase domain-containing protein n=1 Tax=Paenibacillus sp. BIHB 4019 TaxID=1870819 RepID=A0A1B2DSR3_9BACL|nr:hypothetical protein BBD42_15440 [Paenibacillus sp. BIHB 4019]
MGNVAQTQSERSLAEKIAADFRTFLDAWHSRPETYDNALDAQIHRWYTEVLTNKARQVWPPRNIPYFSPSAANADARGLYEKLRGAKRDGGGQPPYQGRWTRIGTAIGDIIQRDILFAEKHTESPRFTFERNERGEPMFEDFAKKSAILTHRGKTFALYGTGDGIMRYVAEDGSVIRVGLEVKSKQTTAAQTSDYSTRNGPKEDHVKQCVCYSLMYGTVAEPLDYYVILYVNGSKKSWQMSAEDYAKNPDIKVFGIEITNDMRREVLDRFANIVEAADAGEPPALDIGNWTFNNFKRAIASTISDEEYTQIERQVAAIQRSGLKDFEKRNYAEAFGQLTELRRETR